MTQKTHEQTQRLKRSLAELRSNRHHFSDESFAQITIVLLQALRSSQTEALPGDSQADEIRLVTVMFVDVKDSTEMVQRLDTSDWKSIIAQAHGRIAALVSQWGGQVGQYLGDGVMCFFGARDSQDADAVNAVSCGLAIQEAMAQYAQTVAAQYEGIAFAMRIGISTGQLVVGLMGEDQKREFLALGPATNRAARLQGIAEPGEVFIDEATHARVRNNFAVKPREPALLKGFQRAVQVYQVLGRRERPATHFTTTDIEGIYLPLMGREEPLALMEYLTEQAVQSRRGQVITLLGDIGVGKSRLLQAAARRLDNQFRILTLKTSYEARLQRHNLIVNSARTYGYSTNADDDADAQQRATFRSRMRNVLEDGVSDAAAEATFALCDGRQPENDEAHMRAVIAWLAKVAQQKPLLILVDNLQWVDAESVRFLRELASALQDTPGVIMAAGRLNFLTAHPDFLKGNAQYTRILLDPLPENAARLLVNSVLQHVRGVPSALVDRLVERSEGNPLFIHEYLTMLFDLNIIEDDDEAGWRLNFERYNDALNTLPHGLIALLQARLDELAPEARQVLQVAAVMGTIFWAGAVEAMTRLSGVQGWLDLLTTQGILLREDESLIANERQYRFRYTLYHNVAYEMIPRGQRLRYHQLFAEWLLLQANGQAQAYPLLATQFSRGEQYAAALYTYQEAVQDRLQHADAARALELIDEGLGLASHLPRSEALPIVSKLWMYRGEALCLVQRYEEASAACQSALMLTRELPADQFQEVRAAAEMTLSEAFTATGRSGDALDALNRARSTLSDDATALQAALAIHSARLAAVQGRMDEATSHYEQAIENATRAENQRYQRMAQNELAMLLLERGRIAEALTSLQQQRDSSQDGGVTRAGGQARVALAQAYLALELPMQALAMLDEASSDGDDLPGFAAVRAPMARALAYLRSGDPVQQKEGKKLLQTLAEVRYEHLSLRQEVQVAHAQGLLYSAEYEAARALLLPLVQSSSQGSPLLQGRRLRLLGEALYRLGSAEAQHYLQEALQAEKTYGGRDLWRCHTWLGRTATDEPARTEHQQQAAKAVQALADSLSTMPELQSAFLAAPTIRAALQPTPQTG